MLISRAASDQGAKILKNRRDFKPSFARHF